MATSTWSCFSSASISCSSPSYRSGSKPSLLWRLVKPQKYELHPLSGSNCNSSQFLHGTHKPEEKLSKRLRILFATSEDRLPQKELNPVTPEQESLHQIAEEIARESELHVQAQRTDGKPGFVSFHGLPYKIQDEVLISSPVEEQSYLFWFLGPTVLVASLVFPSLYLRRLLSTVFEDSLLTDFLILFFTEALFYGGVAIFILLTDHVQRPLMRAPSKSNPQFVTLFGHRISSVAFLVLSLIIPLVTMGWVWPWTGPAASATLAPYLVGLVVQFAFEQYVRYQKSLAWPMIPVIFQIYRLHQLNRAAQLVTALSFSVRGAETTAQTLAINSSLGTLLNVLQFLGVICIWSLASFLMRFFPSPTVMPD